MNNGVDRKKISHIAETYIKNWSRMAAYDQDDGDITWHVENCMNYIITLSEDNIPTWLAPSSLALVNAAWNEHELVLLYKSLVEAAVALGYTTDTGMMSRVKSVTLQRRRRVPRVSS